MPSRRFLARPALFAALMLAARSAVAAPDQFLPVTDRLETEWRVLELYADSSVTAHVRLPHRNSGPSQFVEWIGPEPAPARFTRPGARDVALARIDRAIHRDAPADFTGPDAPHSTPRLLQWHDADGARLEASVGLEGERAATRAGGVTDARWLDGSGVHVRAALQVDRWLAFSHLAFGELRGVRAFSDPLVANSDVAVSTEESYLAYTAGRRWSAQIGRSRWAWGPGEEGSLLLSRTSAPITGLMLHARLEGLRADAFVLSATVEPGLGEQLAAHRLEWQPRDGLRLGASEAARYHAGGWQGVYLAGVIPYAIAQKLLDQDHHDPAGLLRNNVMLSLDGSWRIAEGSRAYGEVLIDDLHARSAATPNKYGWQVGWDGAGEALALPLAWNVEFTRLSRYVYTSFFGRAFEAQGAPLGFPTGPDARRLRVRVTANPSVDWQVSAIASRTDKGENDLEEPFVPGDPVPPVGVLAGVVERTRTLEGELRAFPASGIDLAIRFGRAWSENAGHVPGLDPAAWTGTFAFRLTR